MQNLVILTPIISPDRVYMKILLFQSALLLLFKLQGATSRQLLFRGKETIKSKHNLHFLKNKESQSETTGYK